MLVGRCSWELSGRKLTPEDKNSERARKVAAKSKTACGSSEITWETRFRPAQVTSE